MWKEKEIFAGDRGVIFGLLEELHKFYDGVTDNSQSPYFGLEDIDCSLGYSYQNEEKNKNLPNEEIRSKESTLELPIDMPLLVPEHIPAIKESTLGSVFGSGIIGDIGKKLDSDHIQLPKQMFPTNNLPQSSLRKKLFQSERIADIEPKEVLSSAKKKEQIPKFSQSTIKPEPSAEMEYDLIQPKDKEEIFEWLQMIGVKLPPRLNLNNQVLEEFSDG